LSQFDVTHLAALQNYNRALMQRNKFLKTCNGTADPILVEMWDRQLIQNGEILYANRKKFVADFEGEFQKYYALVSSGCEVPTLTYSSQLDDDSIANLLKNSLQRDQILQHTTCGVHKDDLIFEVGGLSLKNCGSQGQQKTFLTALKLAQFSFLNRVGKKPILLLDDIFDKLDPARVNAILEIVLKDATFGQIFITHTSPEDLEKMLSISAQGEYEVYRL
jgi:DNA replication and repair protein RecF